MCIIVCVCVQAISQYDSDHMIIQFGETALVKAAYRGWVEICQMLIDAGADVNAQDIVSYY